MKTIQEERKNHHEHPQNNKNRSRRSGRMSEKDWKPIDLDNPDTFPPVDEDGHSKKILISFANFSIPFVGEYRVDDDGGAFYEGDEDTSLVSYGLIVNAWMPLPKCYREDG